MALDIENIETVADVENMDLSTMDMGDSLEAPPSDDAVREEKEARAEQDSRIYESVKTALLACLRGYNPKIALEFARKTLPSNVRPAFSDFEQHLKTVK